MIVYLLLVVWCAIHANADCDCTGLKFEDFAGGKNPNNRAGKAKNGVGAAVVAFEVVADTQADKATESDSFKQIGRAGGKVLKGASYFAGPIAGVGLMVLADTLMEDEYEKRFQNIERMSCCLGKSMAEVKEIVETNSAEIARLDTVTKAMNVELKRNGVLLSDITKIISEITATLGSTVQSGLRKVTTKLLACLDIAVIDGEMMFEHSSEYRRRLGTKKTIWAHEDPQCNFGKTHLWTELEFAVDAVIPQLKLMKQKFMAESGCFLNLQSARAAMESYSAMVVAAISTFMLNVKGRGMLTIKYFQDLYFNKIIGWFNKMLGYFKEIETQIKTNVMYIKCDETLRRRYPHCRNYAVSSKMKWNKLCDMSDQYNFKKTMRMVQRTAHWEKWQDQWDPSVSYTFHLNWDAVTPNKDGDIYTYYTKTGSDCFFKRKGQSTWKNFLGGGVPFKGKRTCVPKICHECGRCTDDKQRVCGTGTVSAPDAHLKDNLFPETVQVLTQYRNVIQQLKTDTDTWMRNGLTETKSFRVDGRQGSYKYLKKCPGGWTNAKSRMQSDNFNPVKIVACDQFILTSVSGYSITQGKHCGGNALVLTNSLKEKDVNQCASTCNGNTGCKGFIVREIDNVCGFFRSGILRLTNNPGHHCYRKPDTSRRRSNQRRRRRWESTRRRSERRRATPGGPVLPMFPNGPIGRQSFTSEESMATPSEMFSEESWFR